MSQQKFYEADRMIRDSLQKATQYLEGQDPAAVERIINTLLKQYPNTPAFATSDKYSSGQVHYRTTDNYPDRAHMLRGIARDRLGNYKGAEADFTLALRGLPERHIYADSPPHSGKTWTYYKLRATVRLEKLNDHKGGCADMAVLYQLDSTIAQTSLWGNCPKPAHRFVTNPIDRNKAHKIALDSLSLAQTLLQKNQHKEALRILTNLINGNVGNFKRYWVNLDAVMNQGPGLLHGLRAQAREGLGDYRGAIADLDTAIWRVSRCTMPGDGHWRYQRGRIKIDYLHDREGGCPDLVFAYQCDTTVTGFDHKRWRGCSLPPRKRAIGDAERKEARQAFTDSIRLADTLIIQKQYDRALEVATPLVKGYAGRFAEVGLPGYGNHDFVLARTRRSYALQGLKRYTEAIAELDTAINRGSFVPSIGSLYCQIGMIKIDYLNDSSGCSDIRKCYFKGYKPADNNWRGCQFKERTGSYRFREYYLSPVLDDLDTWSPRLGLFYQGQLGLELGMLRSTGQWLENWGPSVGLDIMRGSRSGWPVVAPKLAFEYQVLLLATRLDFTYYYHNNLHDLRLTPQVGLSLLGVVNVLYGYSLPLLSNEQPFLTRNRFSLYINFVEMSKIGG